MIRQPFGDDWTVGPKPGVFEAVNGGATPPRATVVPYDAVRDLERSVESDQGVHAGYHPGGVFEYAKTFFVPEEWRSKVVTLEFEGVYRDAVVTVNGAFAHHERGGYTAFAVDLDPFLQFGEANRIAVAARVHRDSRWYSGGGIYRPVWLSVADPVHLPLDATTVTTPDVDDGRAIVELATTVVNATRHTALTRVSWQVTDDTGAAAATASAPVTVLPGEPAVARVRVIVDDPHLWSPDSPALYRVRTSLARVDGGDGAGDGGYQAHLDEDVAVFGIRRLQLDVAQGLRINGATVKLRGACVHHDNGVLGAATFASAEERRVRLLKSAGFNALRSAHNPMSRAMLDACDRHGLVVMDELTDVWTRPKTAFDASATFAEDWPREVAAMVAKDRNHPSVVMYSIGNEILELATPLGAAWGRRIAEEVRRLDPTRFVTNGINGVISNVDRMAEAMAEAGPSDPNTMMAEMGEAMSLMNASVLVGDSIEESASVLDVVGLNYAESRYALDAELFPHRVIVGSETFPSKIDVMWDLVERLPHVIGDFTWTGWDYLGESGIGRIDYTDAEGYTPTGTSGPFPYLLAETGDLDITGHRRPVSHYREIVFGLAAGPSIAVHRPRHHGRPTARTPWSSDDVVSTWAWDAAPGDPVVVDVYARADEVELLLDGRSLGVRLVGERGAFIARFDTQWRPGELTAVARRRDGVEVGRAVLSSGVGDPELVALAEDPSVDVGGLGFVVIELRDAAGTVLVDRDVSVTVGVDGPAVLAGLGTGRAATEERFDASSVTLYDGRALAVLRPTRPGVVTAIVTADGFAAAAGTFEVTPVDR